MYFNIDFNEYVHSALFLAMVEFGGPNKNKRQIQMESHSGGILDNFPTSFLFESLGVC